MIFTDNINVIKKIVVSVYNKLIIKYVIESESGWYGFSGTIFQVVLFG